MFHRSALRGAAAVVAVLGLAACADHGGSRPGNPSGTAAERAVDRAAGTNTSGAYPAQSDGTRVNPPGTAVQRAYDRTTNSDTSGAYPNQANRPGTAAERALDRTAGTNTSGAYPAQRDCTAANPPGTAVSRALGTTNPNDCR